MRIGHETCLGNRGSMSIGSNGNAMPSELNQRKRKKKINNQKVEGEEEEAMAKVFGFRSGLSLKLYREKKEEVWG